MSLLWVVFFQTIAIGWCFGAAKFCDCVEQMTGTRPNIFFYLCWKFFAPAVMVVSKGYRKYANFQLCLSFLVQTVDRLLFPMGMINLVLTLPLVPHNANLVFFNLFLEFPFSLIVQSLIYEEDQ